MGKRLQNKLHQMLFQILYGKKGVLLGLVKMYSSHTGWETNSHKYRQIDGGLELPLKIAVLCHLVLSLSSRLKTPRAFKPTTK